MSEVPAMTEILGADAPTNWGKWGPDDELGALNYLDAAEVLDDLADACAADNRWTFLYVAAPLKVVGGTGAPVNPVAIR